jgi:hypothetical protein
MKSKRRIAMILPKQTCLCCIHYTGHENIAPGRVEKHHCKAFPEGIPDIIIYSFYNHRQPYPSDNGIRFQFNPEKEEFRSRIEQELQKDEAVANRERAVFGGLGQGRLRYSPSGGVETKKD